MAYIGFDKLTDKLKGRVRNPEAVAASIGRKKYGKKAFNEASRKGKKLRGRPSMKALHGED